MVNSLFKNVEKIIANCNIIVRMEKLARQSDAQSGR